MPEVPGVIAVNIARLAGGNVFRRDNRVVDETAVGYELRLSHFTVKQFLLSSRLQEPFLSSL